MMTYPFIETYCRKMPIRKSYSCRLEELRRAFDRAEHVVIGAGAGLSAAAGLEYGGRRFTDNFSDFIARYDLRTCTPRRSIPSGQKRNGGHTGQDISG